MLFLATCVGMVVYYQSEKKRIQDERTQRLMEAKEVGKPKLGGPFELIDHDGKPVTNRDYLGRFSLIYFGFCHCPDICPDELDKIGEAVELLDQDPESRDMVTPLFITCDPQRDDPATIKQYLKEFHPKIIGLTGTIDQVRKACKTFRVYFSKPPKVEEGQDYLVDHSIFSYLMDSNGNFVDIYGKERTSAEMADSIKKYIKAFKSSSGGQ
ncbi:Cu-binding protein [Spiromyces aspiralis]|uniref:Cu-binding protein n=1 Tax=Spiromyces aspiralis TaxID=68401 RepID=A0ACC1HB90_9FUNG|nr:Cu-binding protein [Spiromyces aspiralis]